MEILVNPDVTMEHKDRFQCPINEDHELLIIFYKEKNILYCLLGRDSKSNKNNMGGTPSQSEVSYSDSEPAFVGNVNQFNDEEDDDSSYFVKITIDLKFIFLLQDPMFKNVADIRGKYNLFTATEVF